MTGNIGILILYPVCCFYFQIVLRSDNFKKGESFF